MRSRSRIWTYLAPLLLLIPPQTAYAAAPVCTSTKTELVSINSSGTTVGNDDSSVQDINEDGRFVAFRSHATDIVGYPVNRPLGTNIYLRDRLNGTVQVLDDHPPGQGFNDTAQGFVLSGDGHAIAFDTLAGNVVAGVPDTNGKPDVYVKDFRTGSFLRATVPDSSITATNQSQHTAANFSTNRDARYVAFVSSGLVFSPEYYAFPEPTNVFNFHIYVRDTAANRTYLVTRGANAQGQTVPLNNMVGRPVLTANGQLLAFTTNSTNLRNFPNPTARRDVYIAAFNGTGWDVIERITAGTNGIDNNRADEISISPDGRYVAYIASENGGTTGELYVYDRQDVTTFRPRPGGARQAFSSAHAPRLGNSAIAWLDYDLTGEGASGAFRTDLPGLLLQRVGRETNGAPACCGDHGNAGEAGGVALSADGRWATYHSASPRITPPDGNGNYDVFVQRMTPVADFTFACNSLTCSFDATVTQSACPIWVYKWSWGDGTTGTGAITAHTYANGGQVPVTLTISDVNGINSAVTKLVTPVAGPGAAATSYVTLNPCRLWDSRTQPNGRISSGQELILSITNPTQGCAPNPNARAASVNVTVVTPSAEGYLSAYAAGSPSATAALNFAPATSPRANNMIVPVAANGTIALKPILASGSTDLVVDIGGYFTDAPGAGVTPLGFQSLTPCRVYDSRLNGGAPFTAGETRSLQIRGNCGIPSGAAAASLNAAVVGATTPGHLTLFPAGTSLPLAANMNYPASPTGATANGARVTLGAGSPDLSALMAVYGGTAHLVLDANGYFKNDAPLQYTSITPCRALDTRLAAQGPALTANETRTAQIRGNCGVPSDAKAAMVNLTVVGPTSTGYVLAYPSGTTRPVASTLNFPAGEPAEGNGAIVPLSPSLPNDLSIFALLTGGNTTHVVVDVFGYFR